MKYKIPLYKPFLVGNEAKYVNNCIKSNYISSRGEYVTLFEKKFAEYIGIKYATTCSNGTCAIHLAIALLGISYGDEVILPTLTFIASANSVVNNGATPVFVDVDYDWQINPDEVRKKITKKTKAVMAVHLYGFPCNLDELKKICSEYNLYLIEDCAEALGSKYKGKYLGNFGNLAAFSFYGNKTITTGEGGMLVTNNYKFYDKAKKIKSHGAIGKDDYYFVSTGFNFRMNNLSAAIGLAQLENIKKIMTLKRSIEGKYRKLLKSTPVSFYQSKNADNNCYWLITILVENKKYRDSLRGFLKINGIETKPFFYPLHTLPMFKNENLKCPVAESISEKGISLPSYPSLTDAEIEYICNKINEFYGITKLN